MPSVTASNPTIVPTGEYLVQVTDYKEDNGQYGEQFKFTLEIVAPKKYENEKKLYWASPKITGGKKPSNLFRLVTGAFGREPVMGKNPETVDIDDLIGRQVICSIVSEDGENGERNKIIGFKAYSKQSVFPMPEPAKMGTSPAEPDDDDLFSEE